MKADAVKLNLLRYDKPLRWLNSGPTDMNKNE